MRQTASTATRSPHASPRRLQAADAAHVRAFEQAQFGEASADAIVDSEYYDDLAAAWSLVAGEHQLISPDAIFAHDGSVH